ncbi:HAD hydrolase-like protein [Clostridium sp. ZBS15]|uniref:HAD hydrolase-like protein n=1 Tax=Clostridium sp. ZBS15 TaxID=2949969 RepID=UPI00207AD207|nr:HAD hydrolase-like protein [Clostridium sp. ZBS15]
MKKYNCVIFDLDGTLMDTSIGVLKSVKYTINKMKFEKLSEEELRLFIGPPIQNSFKDKYTLDDNKTNEAAAMFRNAYKEKFLYHAKIFSGIIELLSYLRSNNILTMVATYKREDYTLMLLEYFGLSKYFDFIKGSDMDGKLTKADIVNLCIEKSNQDKEKAVLVGDTNHDLLGAKQAGIDFIAVTYGFGFKKGEEFEDTVYVCDSVTDLHRIL